MDYKEFELVGMIGRTVIIFKENKKRKTNYFFRMEESKIKYRGN